MMHMESNDDHFWARSTMKEVKEMLLILRKEKLGEKRLFEESFLFFIVHFLDKNCRSKIMWKLC